MRGPPPLDARGAALSRLLRAAFYVLCGCSAAACVVSVQPAVPESLSTFDARLLGTWGEPDSGKAVVTRGARNAYVIEFTDEGKTGRFEAHLGSLGTHRVLEVRGMDRRSLGEGHEAAIAIRGHHVFVIEVFGDSVRTYALNGDSIRARRLGPSVPISQDGDNHLVLGGTTEQLRAALTAYLARPGGLGEAGVWKRTKN